MKERLTVKPYKSSVRRITAKGVIQEKKAAVSRGKKKEPLQTFLR